MPKLLNLPIQPTTSTTALVCIGIVIRVTSGGLAELLDVSYFRSRRVLKVERRSISSILITGLSSNMLSMRGEICGSNEKVVIYSFRRSIPDIT